MFMLRCVFWLSVMFASMPVGSGILGDWRVAGDTMKGQASHAAFDRAETWCAAQIESCARDAGRLTSLFATTDRADASEAGTDEVVSGASIVRAPARRRSDKTLLTDRR